MLPSEHKMLVSNVRLLVRCEKIHSAQSCGSPKLGQDHIVVPPPPHPMLVLFNIVKTLQRVSRDNTSGCVYNKEIRHSLQPQNKHYQLQLPFPSFSKTQDNSCIGYLIKSRLNIEFKHCFQTHDLSECNQIGPSKNYFQLVIGCSWYCYYTDSHNKALSDTE